METNQLQYRDLNEFLAKHIAKQQAENPSTTGITYTHTRIGDKILNIFYWPFHLMKLGCVSPPL